MTIPPQRKIKIVHFTDQTWFGRLFASIFAFIILLLSLFFFSIIFAVFLGIAVVLVAWVVWTKKVNPQNKSGNTIEGEYSVEDAETKQADIIIKRSSRD